MRVFRVAPAGLCVVVAAIGVAACGSSSSKTTTAASVSKARFCAANDAIDRASANVNSDSGFLVVLKANHATIDEMLKNIPSGSIHPAAEALLTATQAAIAKNNANIVTSPALNADGASVDTYCHVNGNGISLPADFGAGKGSAFCTNFGVLYGGVTSAATPADALKFVKAHQTQINFLAAKSPAAIKSETQLGVKDLRTAIATNNPSKIENQPGRPGMHLAFYCGINM